MKIKGISYKINPIIADNLYFDIAKFVSLLQ